MSAFIVSKGHIDALVSRGGPQCVDAASAALGKMLWLENYKSVAYRYDTTVDLPGPIDFTLADLDDYVFEPPVRRLSVVELLKAIDCYEYQSCEHPEWPESAARDYCAHLRNELISKLPGYSEAAWEID